MPDYVCKQRKRWYKWKSRFIDKLSASSKGPSLYVGSFSVTFHGTVDAARFCEYDTWHVGFQLTNQYDTWAAAISPEPPFVPTLVGSHLAYSTSNVIIVFPQVSSFPHWIYSLILPACKTRSMRRVSFSLSNLFLSFYQIETMQLKYSRLLTSQLSRGSILVGARGSILNVRIQNLQNF